MVEEQVGDLDRLVEQAARIVAQVDDIAERRGRQLLVDVGDRLRDSRRRSASEKSLTVMMPTPSSFEVTGSMDDDLARHRDVERLVAARGGRSSGLIVVPGVPRILATASSSVSP